MKLLLKYGVFIFTLMFIVAVVYKNESYNAFIEQADLIFSQSDSEFVNNWYNSAYEQDQIIEQNKLNTQDDLVSNDVVIPSTPESSTNPLDTLVVPTFTSGVEAYLFAENVLSIADGLQISISGTATASVATQKIKSIRKRDSNGNLYLLATTYSSFKKTGLEAYYNGRQFKTRTTTMVGSDLNAKFSDAAWKYTSLTAYASDFGVMPDELNYIVNSNTVLEESNFKFENGLYTFTLKLNPETSTQKYKYNVRANAGSDGFPTFKSVTLEVTIDQNARFKSIHYIESYTINVGIIATANTDYTETYDVIHGPVTIDTPSGF